MPKFSGARQAVDRVGGRFGALPNAHLHFHVVVIDGVFFGEEAETLRFEEVNLTRKPCSDFRRRSANASSASAHADAKKKARAMPYAIN